MHLMMLNWYHPQIGLAVDDIKGIQDESHLKRLALEVRYGERYNSGMLQRLQYSRNFIISSLNVHANSPWRLAKYYTTLALHYLAICKKHQVPTVNYKPNTTLHSHNKHLLALQ